MKRTIKSVILSGVGLALWGGASLAADIAVPVTDWTGFYVGIGGGVSFNDASMSALGYGYFESEDWDCWGEVSCDGAYPDWSPYGGVDLSDDVNASIGAAAGFGDLGNVASALDIGDYADFLNDFLGGGSNDSGEVSFSARGEIGADYQLADRFVLGVNAAYAFGNAEINNNAIGDGGGNAYGLDDNCCEYVSGGGTAAVESELTVGNSWSVGARAGYLVTDNWLLFGTIGYTQAKAELKASFDGSAGAGTEEFGAGADWNINSSDDEWLDGVYFGAGMEALLTDHVSLKVEYRYVDLGTIKTSKEVSAGDYEDGCCDYWEAGTGVSASADLAVHSVFATVSYRF